MQHTPKLFWKQRLRPWEILIFWRFWKIFCPRKLPYQFWHWNTLPNFSIEFTCYTNSFDIRGYVFLFHPQFMILGSVNFLSWWQVFGLFLLTILPNIINYTDIISLIETTSYWKPYKWPFPFCLRKNLWLSFKSKFWNFVSILEKVLTLR